MWRRSAAAVTRGGGDGIASPPSYARGYALLIGVAFGWGFNWPLMKIIVTEVPVWQFRGFSGIAAGLLLLGLAIAVSRTSGEAWRTPREQWLRLCLAALFNVTSWFIFIGYGVSMMGAGHAVIMGFTMPLFAAVFGVTFLGEPMTRRRLAALCLGAAGIAVLMSHDFSVIGAEPLGFVLTLIGAALWSVGVLIQKHTPWKIGVLALGGWQILLGCLPIFAVCLVLEDIVYHRASPAVWWATVYLVLVALVFCYFAWFSVVKIFPASVSAVGTLLVPIVGVASGVAVLGEPFGLRDLVALVLIVGAVALVLLVPAGDPVAGRRAPGPR